MRIIRLETRIKEAEGLRLVPYKDILGVWTVGWGTTSWLGKKIHPNMRITVELAEAMYRYHIYSAIRDASTYVNNFSYLGHIRREALVEMAYQLGGRKQRLFVNQHDAIEAEDWNRAYQETIDSKWYDQTPARCFRIADMLLHGDNWPFLERVHENP